MVDHAIPPSEDHSVVIRRNSEDGVHLTIEQIQAKEQTKRTFFLLGCTVLLPWTAVINEMPFFLSRLADSPFYPTFGSYITSIYLVTKMISQFYFTITLKQSSPSRRIFASCVAMILIVAFLCLSTFIRGTPSTFFAFSLFTSASLAVAAGCMSTGVYAEAAVLGPSCLQMVLLGNGAILVMASLVQVAGSVISLWGLLPRSASISVIGPGDAQQPEELAALIFFGVSVVFLCITLVAYTWLARQTSYKSLIGSLRAEQHSETGSVDELTGLVAHSHRHVPMSFDWHVYQVFQQNFVFMFSLSYVYIVSMALYPAITTRVQSTNPNTNPLLFTSVHSLVYSIGDLVGRYVCRFSSLAFWSAERVLALSLLRTPFVPLILLCNIHRATSTALASPAIQSDVLFMVVMLALGFTTGHVFTLAMLVVSSLEHNPGLKGRREDVDVVATLGGSFTLVGLATGTLCSFVVQTMI